MVTALRAQQRTAPLAAIVTVATGAVTAMTAVTDRLTRQVAATAAAVGPSVVAVHGRAGPARARQFRTQQHR